MNDGNSVLDANWEQGWLLGKYQDNPELTINYPDLGDKNAIYSFWRGFETGCADVAEYDQRYELARQLMPDNVYNAMIATVPLIF